MVKTGGVHRNSPVAIYLLLPAIIVILSYIIYFPSIAEAVPEEVKWSVVEIPSGGEAGGWVLAGGSDVKHLAMTDDGTLYCYANPSATNFTLFRSTDGGFRWSSVAGVTDTIVDIAAVTGTGDIYYATESNVYKSVNNVSGFIRLPAGPGSAGTGNVSITCIDVIQGENSNIVIAGTSDNDTGEYGGVYILNESEPLAVWTDTNIGNYDVCKVSFSPDYVIDFQILAVVTDEQDTVIRSRIDNSNWGLIFSDAVIDDLVAVSADIAFPDDYDAVTEDFILFIAVNSGNSSGDVYRVYGARMPTESVAVDLNIGAAYNLEGIDVSTLDVSGDTTGNSLLAGAAGSTQIYRSTDDGVTWKRSTKEPTGQSGTCLIMSPDFIDNRIAYAATSGEESAFSFTVDGGITWNQAGMIDTGMSGGIIDIAVSHTYSSDNCIFMLTLYGANAEHSLWRRMEDGLRWERVLSGTLDEIDGIDLVELSPESADSVQVLYLAGTRNGAPVLIKSTDNGQTYVYINLPYTADVLVAESKDTVIIGSYNGSSGLIYKTSDGGISFSNGTAIGNQPLASIVLSPDYGEDMTILAGSINGWVYLSTDNGSSFRSLPLDAVSAPLGGAVSVAFDSGFSSNNIVYALNDSADKGVYRFKVGTSAEWERVDSNLPVGGILSHLAVSDEGVLYSINAQSVDSDDVEGGMERSLNPAYSLGPTFETVIRGLGDGVILGGLWLQGNQLWSVDTVNIRLMTYIDSLAGKVALVSPLDEAPGNGVTNVMLNWQPVSGATEYTWQIDYDTDFSSVPADYEGSTRASSVRLPDLELDSTYYWRVRVTEPVLSRWSDRWSFSTTLGNTIYAPTLLIPKAGENGIPLKPVFQWSALAGADKYELLVSRDVTFSGPVVIRMDEYAIPATAWQSDISLEYGTTYYWKVRASGSGSSSDWSATSIFTTEMQTDGTALTPEPVTPSFSPVISDLQVQTDSLPVTTQIPEEQPQSSTEIREVLPDWALYFGGALLLVIVLLLVTLLVAIVRIKRV